MEIVKILKITEFLDRRQVIPAGVEFLKESIKQNGFLDNNPIVLISIGDGCFKLIDGRHRLEASIELEKTEIPAIIKDGLSDIDQYQLASQCNNAAETVVLSNFVSDTEFVWRKSGEKTKDGKKKYTQENIGIMLGGKSRSRIADFNAFNSLSPIVWGKIVDDFQKTSTKQKTGSSTQIVETSTITENLLRNILNITEYYQLSIINDLISGKIKNRKVKTLAKTYAERESFAEYAIDGLVCLDDVPIFFDDCFNGLYKTIEQVKKAVKQANDEFEKHNSIRLIPGDCFEILKNDVKDGSCDALITDPPYAILKEDWDSFKSKTEFLKFSREWIALAASKIKSTGRLYIFWSQEFMFDFPFDAIPERFTFGNMLVWNYKNNIKPSNQKKYKYTYEPCFYFYGEDAVKLNLPNDKDWDSDTNDYDVFEFAQPQSNFKDDPKEHPAQKPRKLINQLVNIGSDIGDTVLDCFAGSGTTGVCCKNLKRKAVLIEKDESYLKIISRRLNE